MQNAVLVLQDGKYFLGRSVGKKGCCIGEICFTTGVTGYQHAITDPSFACQIITFSFPHVGNVGINTKDNEGRKVFASGVIMRELSCASHPSSYINLNDWLNGNNIVGISGVDTRALIRYLKKHPFQVGIIFSLNNSQINDFKICNKKNTLIIENLLVELKKYKPLSSLEIINKVSLSNNFKKNLKAKYRVIIVDFGVKTSIVSRLMELGCEIELIKPNKGFAKRILNMNPDGVLISNGPGDPQEIGKSLILEINIIIKSKIPIFGICMGHQLLAIALGAKTFKMKVGHRGSNHPVYNIINGKVEITSQNHGFVIDSTSLPNEIEVTHISLFDNSVEGIMMKNYPVFSVQYHPEEAPGTHDSHYLFRNFIENIKMHKIRSR